MQCAACGLLLAGCGAGEFRVSSAAEIAQAMTVAKPGDVLVFADGTWQHQAIRFEAKGAPGRPITLRAEPPGKVVLTGASTLFVDGEHLIVSGLCFKDGATRKLVVGADFNPHHNIVILIAGRHNRLTDCAVVDHTGAVNYLRLWGAENRVDHCFFRGKTSRSATLCVSAGPEPNRHRIDANYFGYRPPLGRNGGETIQVGNSRTSMRNSRTLVEGNLFERCDGEGEIVTNKSCENVYRRNTFRSCAGHLSIRHGKRCLVEGNFFLGRLKPGSAGVRLSGEDHTVINNYFQGLQAGGAVLLSMAIPNSPLHGYFPVRNALIAFNTFAGNDVPCFSVARYSTHVKATLLPESATIANNILCGRKAPLVSDLGPGITWVGNMAHGADLGIPLPRGITMTDPRLFKDAHGLWRPAKNSPAIGAAGGKYPSVSSDITGRPRKGKKDVGCLQIVDGPAGHKPLTRADVGPSWMRTP